MAVIELPTSNEGPLILLSTPQLNPSDTVYAGQLAMVSCSEAKPYIEPSEPFGVTYTGNGETNMGRNVEMILSGPDSEDSVLSQTRLYFNGRSMGCGSSTNLLHTKPGQRDPEPTDGDAERGRSTKAFAGGAGSSSTSASASSSSMTSADPTTNDQSDPQIFISNDWNDVENARSRFVMHIVQQPRQSRMCGSGDMDRRMVDPTPVIEVMVKNVETGEETVPDESDPRVHMLSVTAVLMDENRQPIPSTNEPPYRNLLVGNCIASPMFLHANEIVDEEGFAPLDTSSSDPNLKRCLFVFADLSIRNAGRYTIQFALTSINQSLGFTPGYTGPVGRILMSEFSELIVVYRPKDFPGVYKTSPLSRALRQHGFRIPISPGFRRTDIPTTHTTPGSSSLASGSVNAPDSEQDADTPGDNRVTRSNSGRKSRARNEERM
ncbi:velvet factor-domain-containing protein [Cladochytrium replicatum]|nr:velvet factor-domain-containing protein [Cladochytrium replicatum]